MPSLAFTSRTRTQRNFVRRQIAQIVEAVEVVEVKQQVVHLSTNRFLLNNLTSKQLDDRYKWIIMVVVVVY